MIAAIDRLQEAKDRAKITKLRKQIDALYDELSVADSSEYERILREINNKEIKVQALTDGHRNDEPYQMRPI